MPIFFYIFLVFSFIFLFSIGTILPSTGRNTPSAKEKENDRIRELLGKTFPLSKYLVTFAGFLSCGYFLVLYIMYQNESLVEYFIEDNNYFMIIMIFLGFLIIFSFFAFKEYKNVNNELRIKRPNLLLSIIFTLFSLSAMTTVAFTSFTDKFLDFSKPIEEIVTVRDTYTRSASKALTKYFITFEPSLYNHSYFEIPANKYSSIKKGEKIKIIIYNGFWGIKYTNFEFESLK